MANKYIFWRRCWRSWKHLWDQRGMNVKSTLSLKFSHGHLLNKRNKDLLQNLHVFVIQTNLPSGLAPQTCKVCLLRKFLQNSFRLVLQHNVNSKFLEKFRKFHVYNRYNPIHKIVKLGPPFRLATPLRLVTPTIQQGHHIRLLMRPMRASSNPVLFTRMTSAP